MKKFILSFIVLAASLLSHGQGTIRGKITDKNGESVIGASVVLKSNKGYGVTADFDGNYSLKINDSTPQTIIISFISFKPIEEIVSPRNNEVLIKNFVLESSAQNVAEVQIVAKAVKAREYYLENMKKKSATTLDFVSSESMKKTGDATVTAAVARVAGVSTNGSFITVRGIGDRYVKSAINGSRVPTLDPFTNNIKLDLFPASLIDNVLISKTASPDLPGDWAGAYLSVETKDYPEQLSVNIETSFGYNQASFKDEITSQRSKTDWLGYDYSFRDHNHGSFISANPNPSQFQQLVALGLGDYYSGLGVNDDNWYKGADEYFKLGLVQLGLLAPALFNDPKAVSNAKSIYLNGNYASDAFKTINANVPASGKSFPSNWNTTTRKTPLNLGESISIGNQATIFGRPFGFLTGFRYYSSNQYDPHATSNRSVVVGDSINPNEYIRTVSSAITQQSSIETNGWSALLNAAYKLNSNNSISLMFMPNFIGTNKVRKSYDRGNEPVVVTLNQFYEQRKQLVYQLKTEHYIPASKIKIDLNASYTNGKSAIPDFKNLQFWENQDSTYQIGGSIGDGIHRYYRYLTDNILDSRIALEFPLSKRTELVRKFKLGGAYQRADQKFDQYDYFMITDPNIGILGSEDIDAFLNPDQFEITTGVNAGGVPFSLINAYYQELGNAANHTFGNSTIAAGFLMVDYAITPVLRFAGGCRIEQAEIFTDVVKFDSLGLAKNDPRRQYSDGLPLANAGKLSQTSFLPSANVIYKIRKDDDAPINIRLNYSQSVARPGIRELSDVAVYDYELRAPVYGNSDLKPVHIDNYDIRIESYFKSNDNISISLFYKNFKNHIEVISANGYTWQNVDKSSVKGIELEGRKKVTKNLDIAANVTFVKSATTFVRTRYDISGGIKQYTPLDTVTRTMYGQAPYTLNGILTYKADSLGLVLTLSYNVQGPRLVIASDLPEVPDIYELPRHLMDIKVSKTLGKHFGVSFTVKDILNTPITRSYEKESEGYSLDYDRYTYGTNYILAFSYKL